MGSHIALDQQTLVTSTTLPWRQPMATAADQSGLTSYGLADKQIRGGQDTSKFRSMTRTQRTSSAILQSEAMAGDCECRM